MSKILFGRFANPGLLALTALATISGTSLWGALPDLRMIFVSMFGALVGLAGRALAERFRLMVAEQLVVTLGLFAIGGGIVSGPVPSPSAYAAFSRGVIGGWTDLLTTVPPTVLTGELRALPYTLSCAAATLAFLMVKRARIELVAVIAPVGLFAVGLLFSVATTIAPLVQGTLLLVLGIGYGAYAERSRRADLDQSVGSTTLAVRRNRLTGAIVAGAVCVLVAPFAASSIPGFAADDRFNARGFVDPPWNSLDEPSPLAQIKSNYTADLRDDVVFTVTGDEIPQRWTVATLGFYDGTVWTVGSAELAGSARFRPVGGIIPVRSGDNNSIGRADDNGADNDDPSGETLVVEAARFDSPWLPVVNNVVTVAVEGANGEQEADIRADLLGRTIAVPEGTGGATYRITYTPTVLPDPGALQSATVVPLTQRLDVRAGGVRDLASEILRDRDSGWDQVIGIQEALAAGGFYLADDNARPGHSWGRLEAFATEEPLAGNEEQYAALAGAIAQHAGMSARVVVGYLIADDKLDSQTVEITRWDSTAWIEILTEEHGWVAVDVTPPRERQVDANLPTVSEREVTSPNQLSTRNEQDPSEIDQGVADDSDKPESAETRSGIGGRAAVITLSLLLPVIGFFGAVGVIAILKARRRRRRRDAATAAARIVGAWDELNDRIADAGIKVPTNLTNSERSAYLAEVSPEVRGLDPLANAVDQIWYSEHEPDETYADLAWQFCQEATTELDEGASRTEQLRRIANTTTLLERSR